MMHERKVNVTWASQRALAMILPPALIGALLVWIGSPAGTYIVTLTALLFVLAVLFPDALIPIERGMLALARAMSVVMTHVILMLTFYCVITPLGVLLRIMGKDLLRLKSDTLTESYWAPVDPDGPSSRSDKPF